MDETASCSNKVILKEILNSTIFHGVAIINISTNVFLVFTATLGNGIIIVAILRSQNLQSPSYLLITSLAFTDLLVGLVVHPLLVVIFTNYLKNGMDGLCVVDRYFNELEFTIRLLGVISITLVACISIDRYLALTLRHRYPIIVTKKRVRLLIVIVWTVGFSMALVSRWNHLKKAIQVIVTSLALIFLLIPCTYYIKSFRALHLYTVQVHAQQPNLLAGNFDVVRYKKTLKTMLVVLACLLVYYVPLIGTIVGGLFLGGQVKYATESISLTVVLISLFVLNSSINPVIYFVRFTDIRKASLQVLRDLLTAKCKI